jgi:hypothetical protein
MHSTYGKLDIFPSRGEKHAHSSTTRMGRSSKTLGPCVHYLVKLPSCHYDNSNKSIEKKQMLQGNGVPKGTLIPRARNSGDKVDRWCRQDVRDYKNPPPELMNARSRVAGRNTAAHLPSNSIEANLGLQKLK